jgi:hypothetical protein
MSLDGYLAPDGMDLDHAGDPGYKNWMSRWLQLQAWLLNQQHLRQNLQLGGGGETGEDNDLVEQTTGHLTNVNVATFEDYPEDWSDLDGSLTERD